MGAQLGSVADRKAPREVLRFHAKAKGAQVRLDARRCQAQRRDTFHDGIVFSQRPVLPGERVALRVLQDEARWSGGLRVGFTRLDPAHVSSLPPFMCPDLEEQSPTWAAVLPDCCVRAGDVICFWVDPQGQLLADINAGLRLLLRRDVLLGAPLWAVMDVYGITKAIELLDLAASPLPPTFVPIALRDSAAPKPGARAREECAICFSRAANTCLLPCSHTHFCTPCAWRVYVDTAKCPMCRLDIEAVALTGDQPALRSSGGS
ncbi:E3 ubiquitin-protein ligase NEURL3 [Tenrec ecaudatus]|uniref:E3 ubiquitin-protein ligase NEURL3 n=1 Tax=Tenrec ecaudatus TaxID=94439 RepID=UPI003F5908B8